MSTNTASANHFQRAVALLQPFMSAERRDTWLTQAFYFAHRDLYDGIDQQGAPADFTVRCVRRLLDAGCRDGRHALSWLLDVVRTGCGDERQPEFTALIDELDRLCALAPAQTVMSTPAVTAVAKPDRPAVFISYARADAALVKRLVDDLQAAGHACWIDTSDIPGGEVWLEAIAASIEYAYAFVTLVTPAANTSDYVRLEYLHAQKRGKLIIPLLGQSGELPWYIADRQAIPLLPDYLAGVQRLLAALPMLPVMAPVPAGDARSLELAYLYRLQLEELQYIELYTPLAGIARVVGTRQQTFLPAVVRRAELMRPEFTHLACRQERSEMAPTEVKRYDDIVTACTEVHRAVVLGEPGAGKTTALYKLAGTALETALTDPKAPLPMLVRLGEWTAPAQPLSAFIADKIGPLGGSFQTLLQQRRVLLLLDGLNEIPLSERDRKAAEIKTLLHAQHHLPAIVTCRELDYTGTLNLNLDTLTIRPLDPPRIREFVITYLTAAIDLTDTDLADREATGAARGEDLFWKLAGGGAVRAVWRVWQAAGADLALFFTAPEIPRNNPNVYSRTTINQDRLWREAVHDPHSLLRLAGNPYLLYMFTQVYLNLGELPANRAALFGDFIQVLLLREKLAVRDAEAVTVSFTPDGQQLLTALSELAWTMQTQRVQADTQSDSEGDALTMLDRSAAALLGAQRLHRAASASLLAVSDQDVRFIHQLLQEYFTALGLRQHVETGQLAATMLWSADRWWQRSGWEETVILLAGLYGQDCTPVVRWLAEANPEVAAQCIQCSGAHTPDATLEALRAAWLPRLTDLKHDPNPAARAAVGRALGSVRLNGQPLDNRPGVGLRYDLKQRRWLPDIYWVEIPAGPFRYQDGKKQKLPAFAIARYPVTHCQFQAFIEASDGYQNSVWWQGLAEQPEAPTEARWDYANHPREMVNWYEAVAFCRWLSHLLGYEVRLPTEQEWEKAARGTDGRDCPWGNGYRSGYANIYEMWGDAGEYHLEQTTAVGIYPQGASPYEVLD